MKQPEIKDFLNGPIVYDKEDQFLWIIIPNQDMQLLADLRGWGRIQNMFVTKTKGEHGKFDMEAARKFQDEVGEFIAQAINEKIKTL